MNRFEYAAPESVAEVLGLLEDRWDTRVLAGGTDLIHEIRHGIESPSRLVSIRRVASLLAIREEPGCVVLGAAVPVAELERSSLVRSRFPLLAQAAAEAASPQLRNMGTVVGNVCQRPRCWYYRNPEVPCLRKGGKRCYAVKGENKYHAVLGGGPCHIVCPSDLAPALMALDATLTLSGANGSGQGKERIVAMEEFFVGPRENPHRENILRPRELITEIRLPSSPTGTARCVFLKARERKVWDFALASVAVCLQLEGELVRSASVVLGGVAPNPWRSEAAQDALEGQTLNDTLYDKVAEAAVMECRPMRDNAYKVDLIRSLVKRALTRLADQ